MVGRASGDAPRGLRSAGGEHRAGSDTNAESFNRGYRFLRARDYHRTGIGGSGAYHPNEHADSTSERLIHLPTDLARDCEEYPTTRDEQGHGEGSDYQPVSRRRSRASSRVTKRSTRLAPEPRAGAALGVERSSPDTYRHQRRSIIAKNVDDLYSNDGSTRLLVDMDRAPQFELPILSSAKALPLVLKNVRARPAFLELNKLSCVRHPGQHSLHPKILRHLDQLSATLVVEIHRPVVHPVGPLLGENVARDDSVLVSSVRFICV